MPQVKCSVANCAFWGQGNNCNANEIMVEIDQHSDVGYDTEFAADFNDHKDNAANVSNTCCHTFQSKTK